MKVRNMTNSNGNSVKNQFIIYSADGETFQSYNTTIAFIPCFYSPCKPVGERMPHEKIHA